MTQSLPVFQNDQPQAPPSPEKKSPRLEKELTLPEERFWVRYSPHHELPLSSMSSFAIHVVVIVLAALTGWIASRFLADRARPIPVEAITIAGGGGNPEGIGPGPGVTKPGTPEEVVPQQPSEKTNAPPPPKRENLKTVRPTRRRWLRSRTRIFGGSSTRAMRRSRPSPSSTSRRGPI